MEIHMEVVGLLFVATTFLFLIGQTADAVRAGRRPGTAFDTHQSQRRSVEDFETITALITDPSLETLWRDPERQPGVLTCRWECMTPARLGT
jgi:hypothetical protein